MPDATSAAAASSAAAAQLAATTKASSLGGLGKDAFLKLLVAQLKYQNPMQPTDPSQMMGQTAQFTMVEKLEDLATSLQSELAAQRGVLASSLVGKTVTGTDASGAATTGVVTQASLAGADPKLTIGATDVALSTVTTVK
jgi:flagellar basal-body rod modification protein FlgD